MIGPVLIDGRPLSGDSAVRGIGSHLRGLLGGFHALGLAPSLEIMLWRDRPQPPEVARFGLRPGPTIPVLKRRIQPVADAALVAMALRRSDARLFHSVEWAQPLRARIPVVITVHDLIPFLFARDYVWMRRERLLALRQLRTAGAVIAVSQHTAADIARIAHVDPAHITVIQPGVDPGFTPATDAQVEQVRGLLGLERQFVLAVGTFEPRKRIRELLEVVGRVRQDHDVALVIAGDQGVYLPEVRAEIEKSGVGLAVRVLGHVPFDQLIALYSAAECLVFTSAYEGVGLPVLEVQACGTPAVVFANSSLPEVAGPAAILVSDGDTPAMAAAIATLLDEPQVARRVRTDEARSWAAGFTWERAAQAHIDLYSHLAG